MSLLVESTSSASDNLTSSLTITKPTGLAVGELMVAVLSAGESDGGGVGSYNTLAGWTDAETNTATGATSHSVQYKVAEASDVAASNFTFTLSASSAFLNGSILRCSGNPGFDNLGNSATYSATVTSTTVAATLTPYTPLGDGALVILQFGTEYNTGSSNRLFSSFVTTASGISFTTLHNVTGTDGSGGFGYASVYGIQPTAAELSAYGATISFDSTEQFAQIVIFTPRVDATGTSVISNTDVFSPTATGIADTTGELSFTTTDVVSLVQGGEGTSPTAWTNETITETTWTNDTI